MRRAPEESTREVKEVEAPAAEPENLWLASDRGGLSVTLTHGHTTPD